MSKYYPSGMIDLSVTCYIHNYKDGEKCKTCGRKQYLDGVDYTMYQRACC